MPARCEGPQDLAKVAEPLAPPATLGINKDGMTIWRAGQPILHVPREALPGIALRCLVAWHEGG